jgi:hypothetical protein
MTGVSILAGSSALVFEGMTSVASTPTRITRQRFDFVALEDMTNVKHGYFRRIQHVSLNLVGPSAEAVQEKPASRDVSLFHSTSGWH